MKIIDVLSGGYTGVNRRPYDFGGGRRVSGIRRNQAVEKFGQSCERKTMKEEGLLIHGNEQRGNLTGFGRAVKNLTERNKIWLELFVC